MDIKSKQEEKLVLMMWIMHIIKTKQATKFKQNGTQGQESAQRQLWLLRTEESKS